MRSVGCCLALATEKGIGRGCARKVLGICQKALDRGTASCFDQWSVEVECRFFAWTVNKNRRLVGSARNHLKRESSPSPVKGLSELPILRTGVNSSELPT
jgi:hypothetical protein